MSFPMNTAKLQNIFNQGVHQGMVFQHQTSAQPYHTGSYQYYASAPQPMAYQLPWSVIQQTAVQQPQVMNYQPLRAVSQ